MNSSDETGDGVRMGRRALLGSAVGAASLTLMGTASAYHDRYEEVIDVVERGADNGGDESITPVLDDILDRHWDSLALKFPEGRYLMDEQVYYTDFDRLALYGDDATIVPAPADEFHGPSRLFKLGTSDSPGGWLDMRSFTFDFTASNTGLRAIQAQVDDLWIGNIDVVGEHDTGTWGPIMADVLDPSATGLVSNVDLSDGGAYTETTPGDGNPQVWMGPTGILVSPAHRGTLNVRDCTVGAFPDNGLYSSGEEGCVHVEGGTYRNSNVANIRFDGDDSSVDGATVVVDENREHDGNQRGVRFDDGADFEITDTEFRMPEATGEAIRLTGGVDSARIDGVEITFEHEQGWEDVISIDGDAHSASISNTTIELVEGGQAIQVESSGGGSTEPVELENVTVTGEASGEYGGRHAIRVDRDGTVLRNVVVEQPGDDYRRALAIAGDDCWIEGGRYESTHHPIVDTSDESDVRNVEARAYNGHEALKLTEATGEFDVSDSVLYNGIRDEGADDLDAWDNEYPDS